MSRAPLMEPNFGDALRKPQVLEKSQSTKQILNQTKWVFCNLPHLKPICFNIFQQIQVQLANKHPWTPPSTGSVEKPIQPTSDDITGMFSPVRKNEDVIHALLPVLNTQEPFLVQKFRGILGGIPLRLTTIWSNPVAIICPEKNMLFLSVDQGVDTTFLLPRLAWIWPKWFNDSIGYESEMSTIAIW